MHLALGGLSLGILHFGALPNRLLDSISSASVILRRTSDYRSSGSSGTRLSLRLYTADFYGRSELEFCG